MYVLRDEPMTWVRHKTITLRGVVLQGRSRRELLTKDDVVRFTIYDPETNQSVLPAVKMSGSAISQTDEGEWQLLIDPSETLTAALPLDTYRYEVEITLGDTGKVHCLHRGPLTLLPSPFQ